LVIESIALDARLPGLSLLISDEIDGEGVDGACNGAPLTDVGPVAPGTVPLDAAAVGSGVVVTPDGAATLAAPGAAGCPWAPICADRRRRQQNYAERRMASRPGASQ
jgi:hypothetical protein